MTSEEALDLGETIVQFVIALGSPVTLTCARNGRMVEVVACWDDDPGAEVARMEIGPIDPGGSA